MVPLILVDTREPPEVEEALRGLGAETRREEIEWCDYIVAAGGTEVPVERKTARDFVASIEDGRVFLQAYMMSTVAPLSFIVVEGLPSEALMELRFPRPAYIGALASLALKRSPYGQQGRISVIVLDTYYDTALFLYSLHRQLKEGRTWRLPRVQGLAKRRLDRRGALIMMLQAIPGVGPEKARAIAERYPSIRALLEAPPGELERIPGVGPVLARRIREYLS